MKSIAFCLIVGWLFFGSLEIQAAFRPKTDPGTQSRTEPKLK